MKQLLLVTLISIVAAPTIANAQSPRPDVETKEQQVHSTTTMVGLELNNQTVICSEADYGAVYLKVLIPELAELTLLDHRNNGAGAPCVAAGMCKTEWNPGGHQTSEIIDPNRPSENVAVTVTLSRVSTVDHINAKCTVNLREQVTLNIRGIPFFHERWASLGERNYADCNK